MAISFSSSAFSFVGRVILFDVRSCINCLKSAICIPLTRRAKGQVGGPVAVCFVVPAGSTIPTESFDVDCNVNCRAIVAGAWEASSVRYRPVRMSKMPSGEGRAFKCASSRA
jgi:hypothetical protein